MYKIGIDVGSTTIKCVVLDENDNIVYKSYHRHRAMIKEKVNELVLMIGQDILHGAPAYLALTGSASLGMAEHFQIPFVQEVVATQIAVEQYPETVDVVIELGGEDAKILFLTNGVEATQESRLTLSGLRPYLSGVFVSETTGYQKPQREYFDYVFSRISDFDKGRALMIGDSLSSDMKGGEGAGLATCWYNPEHAPNHTDVRVDYEIQELRQLYEIARGK